MCVCVPLLPLQHAGADSSAGGEGAVWGRGCSVLGVGVRMQCVCLLPLQRAGADSSARGEGAGCVGVRTPGGCV